MKIRELNEADRPSDGNDPRRKAAPRPAATIEPDVAYKDDLDWENMFDEPMSKGELSVGGSHGSMSTTNEPKNAPKMKLATADKTRNAVAALTPTDAMRDMMSRINVPDDMMADEPENPDLHDEVPDEPVNPNNVPAVISRAVAASGELSTDPEFHQVKNLPGYISRTIRAMGRATFDAYTSTPIEDVTVIADLGGRGPNSNREVQSVANWLSNNAQKVDRASMDFGASIPGYSAETLEYSTGDVRFLLVKDFAGRYIYAWPEVDSTKKIGRAGSEEPSARIGSTKRLR